MKSAILAVLAAVALAAAAGAAKADPAVAAAAPSRQAVYDQAQAAYDKGDWDGAISGFTAVLASAKSDGRAEGVIHNRLATALLNAGRVEEAQSQATMATATLRKAATGPDADLADAYLTLGDSLQADLSYDQAIEAYKQAEQAADGPDAATQTTSASLGIVLSAMVTHPDLAASTADAILADPTFAAQPREWQAQVLSLRARAEINRGDPRGALPFIEKAVPMLGPELPKVTLIQADIRGDAALVYSLLHQDEDAREYLAYSGAGHLPYEGWLNGADVQAPVCGPEIAPEDTAVVEFAILDDGRTAGATPIYSSRSGQTGVAFARAVSNWRWQPEAVAKLDGFWRQYIRVQLRCATRPPPLSLSEPFYQATREWLRRNGVTEDVRNLGPTSSEVAAPASHSSTGIAAIPALFRRLDVDQTSESITKDHDQLDALLVQTGAPVEARAFAAFAAIGWAAVRVGQFEGAIETFDHISGGARSAAWLRVEMAVDMETYGKFSEARPPLEEVVALPTNVLPQDDPIRNVAILHLSLLDRKAGNPTAAVSRLNAAGLTGPKCDLLDVKPVPTARPVSDLDYPSDAARWGFEGWVQAGFDIAADGSVKDVRALISYPPFVFGPASLAVLSRFRYLPPTLGDTALGCTGQTINFRYNIPKSK